MFNLIKSGVKTMAIIELTEECVKGVCNTMKSSHARRAIGAGVIAFGVGVLVSSYV